MVLRFEMGLKFEGSDCDEPGFLRSLIKGQIRKVRYENLELCFYKITANCLKITNFFKIYLLTSR